MKRRPRIALIALASVVGLLTIIGVTALVVVQTEWFRNLVKAKIVAVAEESTGGRVEIGTFTLEWRKMQVSITNFVLHGTETAGTPPLLKIDSLQLRLKLFSSFKKAVDLRYLGIRHPALNIVVSADGKTNFPTPKVARVQTTISDEVATILDLAVKRFDVVDGDLKFAKHSIPLSATGNNLKVQVFYNAQQPAYSGELTLDPIYATVKQSKPLYAHLRVPFVIRHDAVRLSNVELKSPESAVAVSASLEHIADPLLVADLKAHVSLQEIKATSGFAIHPEVKGAPSGIDAHLSLVANEQRIDIRNGRIGLGETELRAFGPLKDPSSRDTLHFDAKLAPAQLCRLLNVSIQPTGTVSLNGTASAGGSRSYSITGHIRSQNFALRTETQDFGTIELSSAFKVDPDVIELSDLGLRSLGGELLADAEIRHFETLKASGRMRGFQIRNLVRLTSKRPLGYDGTISGVITAGDNLKAKGMSGLSVSTKLSINPGQTGVPVSGRVSADYAGARDALDLGNSFVALPNSRLDLTGVVGKQLKINFVSRNLNDLLPALQFASSNPPQTLPVSLRGGSANLSAQLMGPLSSAHLTSQLSMSHFVAGERKFDVLSAALDASPSHAQVADGLVTSRSLHARFEGSIGLKQWQADQRAPVTLNAAIVNADVADVMALAGESEGRWTGRLNASAHAAGVLGNPVGSATATIENGSAYGESFDKALATVNFSDQLIRLQPAELTAGSAHVSMDGTYTHPPDSLTRGHVQIHLGSNEIALAQFKTIDAHHPGFSGVVRLNGDFSGELLQNGAAFRLAVQRVDADLSAKNLRDKNQSFGDFEANARTSGSEVHYTINSNLAGSDTSIRGVTSLSTDYPTTVDASISSLQVEKALALIGQPSLPIKGVTTANAHLDGSLARINGNLEMGLKKAIVYDEPIDQLETKLDYRNRTLTISSFWLKAPGANVTLKGEYSHSPGAIGQGEARLHVDKSELILAKLRYLQKVKPGVAGTVLLTTDVDARVGLDTAEGSLQVSRLDSDLKARDIKLNGDNFGEIELTSETRGKSLALSMRSNFAKSSIHADGTVQLVRGYPTRGQVAFSNIKYSSFAPFFIDLSGRPGFDALVNGRANIDGPVTDFEALRGSLNLEQLQFSTSSPRDTKSDGTPIVLISNPQPMVFELNKGLIDIRSARLTGRSTDISASGTLNLKQNQALNVQLTAVSDLALLQQFSRDIYSEGSINAQTMIRGNLSQPLANGKIELKNASVNMTNSPNGLSNANGEILLNGTTATFRNLTGESGGGKITLSGFAGLTGTTLRYAMRATATQVRTRYQGASIISSANLNLNGTTERSLLSGLVTINRLAFNKQADVGSILSSTAAPPQSPSAPSGILAGMRLDIRVQTSPALSVQTSIAQNLSANADLTIGGSLLDPNVLGRVVVTQGTLVFFGNRYTVTQGVVNFYNPIKIEPVLDVDLQTTVKGVDVILGIDGPVDNMKLSYRSDPPLRFDEIVALLATGKTPTSDPTIAAHQPTAPDQSLTQMGESAIVSGAIAAPVASRLQRVFGVSQLKIDPSFTSGSTLPQARVTLQQQISPTVVFTYTTDLSQTTAQIIRIEWGFTPRFSAVATRDENGVVSLDFYWKKQYR